LVGGLRVGGILLRRVQKGTKREVSARKRASLGPWPPVSVLPVVYVRNDPPK